MTGLLLALLLASNGAAASAAAVPLKRESVQPSSGDLLRVQLGGKPGPGRWVEVTPLVPGRAAQISRANDDARAIDFQGLQPGPTIFCVGAEGLPTRCERLVLEGQKTLMLTAAAEGVRLIGRVLVGRDPAASARISVIPHPLSARRPFSIPLFWRGSKPTREVACDERGRFVVPLLTPGAYRLDIVRSGGRIDQSAPFTIPDVRTLRANNSPERLPIFDLGDVALEEGVRLEVTVADSAGEPLKSAGVGIIQEREPLPPVLIETQSDAQGKAVLTGIDSELPVLLSCIAPGRVRSEQRLDPPPPFIVCELPRFSSVEGIVLDRDDKPIEGATVSSEALEERVTTDRRGRFVIPHLKEGEYRIAVVAPGFRGFRDTLSVGIEEWHKLPPIRLVPAEVLEGLVVDRESRQPIAGAAVTVVDPAGGGAAVADAEGRFRLAADGAGRLVLETSSAGYPPVTSEVPARVLDTNDLLTIELSPGGRIWVSAWDENQDAPCGGCSIALTQPGGRAHGLRTDGNGETLSPLLAAGDYHVTLESVESLGPVVRVQGGDQVRLTVVKPGETSRVRLGEPRETVEIAFWPLPAAEWMLEASDGRSVQLSRVGPNGTFLVKRKAGEETTLSLSAPWGIRVTQATLPADLDDPSVQLSLPQTSVQGNLVLQGTPLAGQAVALISMAGRLMARAQTDGAGNFQVPYLRPGMYQLYLGTEAVRSFDLTPGATVDLGAIATQ